MSERVFSVHHDQQQKPQKFSLLKTLIESLKIFPRNKPLFFSIFALLALPFSFLLSSLSLSSAPTVSHILRLQSLASLAHTRFEARHVWRESRDAALSLFRLKLLLSLPSFLLSLSAAVTSVSATAAAFHHKPPVTLSAAFSSFKHTWPRPAVTSICIYVTLFLFSGLTRICSLMVGGPDRGLRFVIRAIGFCGEVYVMAVLGMGLVVSILEKGRFGVDAIRVGSGLMEGRRLGGWVLSALLIGVTWWIGGKMEGLGRIMDGDDLVWKRTVMAAEGWWERVGLVGLYAVVVLWGHVVVTVFYCECRKRHVVKEEEEDVGVAVEVA